MTDTKKTFDIEWTKNIPEKEGEYWACNCWGEVSCVLIKKGTSQDRPTAVYELAWDCDAGIDAYEWYSVEPLTAPNIPNELDSFLKEQVSECWYFTFGCGQKHAGKYVVLYGTCQSTRDKMFELFGDKWAFQYKTAEAAGVEKWGYKKLEVAECNECGISKIGDVLEWVEYPDERADAIFPDLRLVCEECTKGKGV